jgi:photosystem II stability/assembly factor-like uncharacterized protein
MKKFIIILIVLFSGFNTSNSQWVRVNQFTNGGIVQDFADNGSIIYAAVIGEGIYKSTNNGLNWFLPDTALQTYNLNAIVAKDSFVFIASNVGLFKSSNFGNNWVKIFNTNSYSLTIISLNNINYVFAGIGVNIYKSSNWGNNWILINNGLPKNSMSYCLTSTNEYVYSGIVASDTFGIFKTTNLGNNWTYITPNVNGYTKYIFSNNNLILGGGVIISTNFGNNWRNIPEISNVLGLFGFSSFGIRDIFVASWSKGFFLSNDTGQTWILKNDGLFSLYVTALRRFNNFLFLSTNYDYSIYRRPISEVIGINNISTEIPISSNLYQNYPNPFNQITKIKYQVSKSEVRSKKLEVRITVYNILGKQITKLVEDEQEAGTYEVMFDAEYLSSGIYFYTLNINGKNIDTKKLIYIR